MANHLSITNPMLSIKPLKEQASALKGKAKCWSCGALMNTDELTVDSRYSPKFGGWTVVEISCACTACGEIEAVLDAEAQEGAVVWNIDLWLNDE